MTDFTWPSDLVPFAMTFNLFARSGGSESPFTGTAKIYASSPARRFCTMEFRGGYAAEEDGQEQKNYGARLDALLADLRGRTNRIAIHDFRRETFGNGSDGLSNSYVAIGSEEIEVAGFEPHALACRKGEYIGGGGRAYTITADTYADADGVASVPVEPPVTAEIMGGSAVYGTPTSWFRLADDQQGHNSTEVGNLATYSLSFVEDLADDSFDTASLFRDGTEGVIFDPSDLSTLYSDTAGTTAAAVDGPVGHMLDKSGNANHWTAASDAARPTLRLDSNGNYYLEFDGSDDTGITGNFAAHTDGAYSSFAAAQGDGTPGDPIAGPDAITAFYSATAANRLFILYVEDSQVQVQGFDDDGDSRTAVDDDLARLEAGVPFVAGIVSDASQVRAYRNGVGQPGIPFIEAANEPGAGAFRIGARDATNQFFDGRFYGAIHVARELDADEIEDADRWLGAKAGREAFRSNLLPYFAADASNQAWMSNSAAAPPAMYVEAIGQTWIAHASWNDRKGDREFRITVYDHDAGEWRGPYLVGRSIIQDVIGGNDDHDLPAITRDGNGYWHLFGGHHNTDTQHFVTDSPDDPTSWTEQTAVAGDYTYAHPIYYDGEIFLFQRARVGVTLNFTLTLRVGTVSAGGAVSWASEVTLVDLGDGTPEGRVYNYKNLLVGDEIHMIFTRADSLDTERKGVYFLKYDTATGDMVNIDGSHSQSATIDLTTADAEYQIIADAADDFVSMDFAYDLIDPTIMHLVHKNGGNWNYRQYVSGVAGSDTIIATADGTVEAMAIFANEEGQVHFYAVDFDGAFSFGGHLRRIIRAASGDWGANELVQSAVNYGIHNLFALDPGHPDLRVIWAESEPATNSLLPAVGVLRMYAHGDHDYLYRRHASPIEIILDTEGAQFLSGFPAGAPIGNVVAYTPTGAPAVNTLRVVGSDDFEIRDGWLYTLKRLTETTTITIEAYDFDRFTSRHEVTLEVVSDSAYTWTNSEGADYVARTYVLWSAARKAALDTFITSLKSASVWQVLDVIVPPVAFQAHAGLQNLRRDRHNATIVNSAKSMTFMPKRAWRSLGTDGGAYIDTGFSPVEAAGYFGRNSASMGIYGSATTDNFFFIGWYDGTDGAAIGINPNGVLKFFINQATQSSTGNGAVLSTSLMAVNRSGASAVEAYVNGVAKAVTTGATTASAEMNDANFRVGQSSALGFAAYGWGGYFIGGNMNSTKHGALNTAWGAYITAMAAAA